MKIKTIFLASIFIMTLLSCEGRTERLKQQKIEKQISEMKSEDSISNTVSFKEKLKSKLLPNIEGDSIIGVWEVKNDYYMAIYEIVKYDDQYFGKIHYYNDGETEIKAQNSKEDYFLDGIFFKDGKYSDGKMYMPDGTYYEINISLSGDELIVKMTVDGQPYSEVWKRSIND